MRRVLVSGLGLLVLGTVTAQTITLHYQDRPPYSSAMGNGNVVGLVASPAERALRAAAIPFTWTLTPGQRQLALIQSGRGLHCGVGWFRSAQREAQGRFSRALYRDRPFGALVRDELPVRSGMPSTELFRSAQFRLLIKEGYSYGAQLDELIARATRAPARTTTDNAQMARMLLAGRADWMIVAPEEATTLAAPGLRILEFNDLREGPSRHLYCSQDLPDEWMARIDQALAAPAK